MIQEVLGQLGFDWKVALANLVNFLIIYLLLRNVVFKKIGEAIEERRVKIQKGLEDAEMAKSALVMADVQKEEILKKTRHEAKDITEKAKEAGDEIIKQSKIEADKKAQEREEKMIREVERKNIEMERELEKNYADLLVLGMEKAALENIDKESAERFLSQLKK